MATILYFYGINNAYAVIRNKNQAATNYIEGYFTPLRSAIQFLSRKQEVIYAVEKPASREETPQEETSRKEKSLSLFKTLNNSIPNINYVYSGYEDETLLINDYTPPEDYDPRNRPWYLAALESAPDISGGVPYREAKTGEWLVSLSRVLTDDAGNLQGVVAIDVSMDMVTKDLFERDKTYSSSYSYVVDDEGTVIIHHRKDLLGKQFENTVDTEDDLSSPAGRSSYTFEKQSKIAYHTRLETLGWTVVTVVNKEEILRSLKIRILLSLAVVIALSLLIGQIISRMLGNKIIAPLKTLEQRVKAIASGSSPVHYPDGTDTPSVSQYSEIDSITKDIEKLAENSLFQKNQELEAKNELLERLSQTDYLTGLLNRRKMYEELEKEYQRSNRYNSTFSVIIVDIDWFKSVNDTHGHDAGDKVLEEVSNILKSMLRSTDSLARWGGEEFLVLCPRTNLEGSAAIAQKIKAAIEKNSFSVPSEITISAGTSEYESGLSLEDLIIKADNKLYQAKSQGRNRVVF
ncbi:MAG: diguanylate cyclase [Spirochaetaceae bacterium]